MKLGWRGFVWSGGPVNELALLINRDSDRAVARVMRDAFRINLMYVQITSTEFPWPSPWKKVGGLYTDLETAKDVAVFLVRVS